MLRMHNSFTRKLYSNNAMMHVFGKLTLCMLCDYFQPFGQLPVFKDDDFELAQSGAILRYLARKHGTTTTIVNSPHLILPQAKSQEHSLNIVTNQNIRHKERELVSPSLGQIRCRCSNRVASFAFVLQRCCPKKQPNRIRGVSHTVNGEQLYNS